MGHIDNYKNWKDNPIKSNLNEGAKIVGYSNFKSILEQNVQNPSGGTIKVPTIEDAIIGDILEDLNSGSIKKDSAVEIAMSVYNSLTPEEITAMNASIKNYSKKVFKNWDKFHEQYRFYVSRFPGGYPKKHDLNVIAVNKDQYVAMTTDGQSVSEWKSIEDIIKEVNAYNASVGFKSSPKIITKDANVHIPDESKPKGYRLGNAIMIKFSGNANQIVQFGLMDVKKNTKQVITEPGTPGKTEVKKLVAKSTGTKGFEVGKYKVSDDSVITSLVNDIESKLKESGEKSFTNIDVVSSASNFWGSPVPATHKLDGTVLDDSRDYKSEPYPGKEIKDLNKGASKNEKLAYLRGKEIANKVKAEAIKRGIASKDAKVSISWRVSDTGGKNDEPGTKTPGQYFKVTASGLGTTTTKTEPTAAKTEDKLTSLNFDIGSFGIALKNLNAKTPRSGNIFGIGQPKNIILKKGGKFFAGGGRGSGGNRNKFSFQGYRGVRGKSRL